MVGIESGAPQGVSPDLILDSETEILAVQANECNKELAAQETPLAELYWRLGDFLNQLRPRFLYGTWHKFLAQQQIDVTRAHRATHIRRCFESPDQVFGLSVEQAIEVRRKQRKRPPSHVPDPHRQLRGLLTQLSRVSAAWFEGKFPIDPKFAQRSLALLQEVNAATTRLLAMFQDWSAQPHR